MPGYHPNTPGQQMQMGPGYGQQYVQQYPPGYGQQMQAQALKCVFTLSSKLFYSVHVLGYLRKMGGNPRMHSCVCVCVCTYVYTYTCVCVCVCVCVCIHI